MYICCSVYNRHNFYYLYFCKPEEVKFGPVLKIVYDEKLRLQKLNETTYKDRIRAIPTFGDILDMKVVDITPEILTKFIEGKKHYARTIIGNYYSGAKQVLDICTSKGIIPTNPMNTVPRPRAQGNSIPVRPMTIEEQTDFVRLVMMHKDKLPYWEVMLISLYTGLRICEICALTADDINLEMGYINVDKHISSSGEISHEPITNGSYRKYIFNSTIRPLLMQIKNNHTRPSDQLLFLNNSRGTLRANNIGTHFRRFVDKYDFIDNSIYGQVNAISLKKTYAQRCLEAGVQTKVIQKQLSIMTNETMRKRYGDANMEEKLASAEKVMTYLAESGI